MKKYTVYSENSRGLGNVMNSDNQLEHMEGSNCSPILTDIIFNHDNLELPVFEIKLNGEPAYIAVELTPLEGSVAPDESLILNATLTNSDGDFIDNVNIFFYENDVLLGYGETVDGCCEYEYSSSIRGEHVIVVKTNDELQYDATSTNVNVYVYYNTSIDLNVSPELIDTADTVVVNTTLLRDDGTPINGEFIEIYNGDVLLNSSVTDDQGECLDYYNAYELKRDHGSNLNLKAVFNKTVAYLPSQSSIVSKTIKLSEPYISLQYPSAQYSIGDIIPLTFLVNDKKGNALEGVDLVINIDGNSYDGVTDAFGQYVMNYTVLSAKDIDITVTSVENNYYSSTSIHETITVGKLNTLTVLTSSNSSSNISFVEEFTLSATVSTDISQPIEGTVSFYDNEVLLDNVSLVDNIANYTYSTNEIKEHNFYAVFNESSEYYSSQSSNLTINIVKDTPIINVITGDIYQSWYTACIITDSLGHPLTDKNINIKVSQDNSTFSSYPQISDGEGKSKLQMNWNPCTVYSQYIFTGDSQYTAVTANKTFIIKSPLTQSKCTGTMTSGSNAVPYREWVDVYSDCDDNYCRCTNIATSSGSYKRPAALTGSVNFNLPANATVKNLKADWKSKLVKDTSSSGYASIGAPTITISGDGSGSAHTKTGGTPGKGSYVSGTFNYSGANAAGLNNGVNVKVQFPANTSGEIGQIYFIGVKLTATYIPAQEVI